MVAAKDGKMAAYALIGAPVWAAKKLTEMTSDFGDVTRREFDEWVKEGEKLAKRLSDRKMVEGLSERMDLDQIQDQVEKLRDQLESVLGNWRESFRADAKKPAAKATSAKATPAKKPATRKPAAKKPATRKPAAKKPATRKPAAKKTAATAKK